MINSLIHWYYNEFQLTDLYQDMAHMAEESPWHRERSIGTHTDMVFAEYLRICEHNHPNSILGGFAVIFHDVGKPGVCQHKWKESRGNYKSFNGHEQLSSRLWEDWAVRNWSFLVERFGFEPNDIYRVGYLIEFHKPWDITKKDKLDAMALTLMMLGLVGVFNEMIKADTFGRISDDSEAKRMKVNDWCSDFQNRCEGLSEHPILKRPLDLTKYQGVF